MKVEFAFSDHVFTATLHDTASARDFASMLPLDLKVTDFSDNEKIAYLPRKRGDFPLRARVLPR